MTEAAVLAGVDPLDFRLKHTKDERLIRLLRAYGRRPGGRVAIAESETSGLACHRLVGATGQWRERAREPRGSSRDRSWRGVRHEDLPTATGSNVLARPRILNLDRGDPVHSTPNARSTLPGRPDP